MPMLNRVVKMAALAAGGVLLAKQYQKRKETGQKSGLSYVEESLEVNAPVHAVYEQWAQFEQFPTFMASVHEVRQLDDGRLHWRASVAGKDKEWDAEITDQLRDQCIAWRSTSGPRNGGVVTFDKISENCTRVVLRMDYEPEGPMETIGDALGVVRMEARANLQRFKEMLEKRGNEPGGWGGANPQRDALKH